MRKIYFLLLTILFAAITNAQLTGTKNIPGAYATLAAAITDLNTQGVGAGGVTLNLLAGNPQTAPAGGYSITASGTVANQIIIQGNGNTITASAALTVGALNDAIFKIIGADYVTITGFTMQENAANTTTAAATNNMTEWGVALLYISTTDGAQNNTISNNTITLNRTYANTFGIYSNVRHSPVDVTTLADITNNTTAPNSNNKFYSNNIGNVNQGFVLIGSATAANMDNNNDIGGASLATGNNVTNYGGLGTASTYQGFPITIINGAYLNDQLNFNLSFNSFISASLNTVTALRGILTDYLVAPLSAVTDNINSNTVTFTQAGAGGLQCITTAGATANLVTMNMNSNKTINNAVTGVGSAVTIFGVANLGAFAALNMNNNTVSGNTSTATTGGFVGATNQGAVLGTINILNNDIGTEASDAVTYSVATTGGITGISNTTGAATTTLNINGNFFRRFRLVSAGQIAYVINSGAAIGVAINMNNNHIGTSTADALTLGAAQASNFFGLVNAAGAATATLSISGNDITRIIQNVTGSGGLNYINNQVFTGASAINNNTFTNLISNSTGTTTLLSNSVTHAASTAHTVNNNSIVTGFNKISPSGVLQLFLSNAVSPATVTETSDGNNFSNITITGTSSISPWQNTDGGSPVTNVTNNTFTNINGSASTGAISVLSINFSSNGTCTGNVISNVTGGGAVTGLSTSSGTHVLSGNTISGLLSSGASASVIGISVTGGTTQTISGNTISGLLGSGATSPLVRGISATATTLTISKNKIYDLSESGAISTTAGAVNGLLLTGGTTVNVSNNLIGDLRAPAANLTDAIRGINITSATASSSINVYYNTVYLDGSSSGINFGTTGIFHTTSTTATTASLTLRNNIIYNNTFAKGTGLVVAYRRSSGAANTLSNYNAASNNNLFFAGAPGASQLIYSDGTSSAQTLAAYQAGVFTAGTIAPRDNASVTELSTPFLSTTGASPNFLHISTAIPTVVESGGANIPAITDDYDGDVRNITTPDIGADEFNGLTVTACAGTPTAGTITGSNNICAGQFTILNLTGYSVNSGISVQWQSSAVSGGPYSDIAGATGTSYNTGVIPTGTTVYYVVKVTCANGGGNATTTQFAVTSNPAPTVTVNPPSPTICAGGSGVNLTASGASTYTWSPATGLSATTGATVTANPTTTTTYTIVGTNVFGCTNSANVTVTVNQSPIITSVTATPSSVCEGGTSQLQVSTPALGTYCASTHASGCGLGDEITNVVLNTLSNPSGCAATAYTLFPQAGTTTTTLTAGTLYTLTVSFGSDGNQYFGAWIDYDRDGTLSPFEFLGVSANAGSNGTIAISFTVPAGAINGTARLRIVGGNDSPPTSAQACGASSSSFGETEDYDITITGGATQYSYSWSPSTFLNNTNTANPIASNITATTTYTITLGHSLNSCTATSNVTVTMNSPVISGSTVVQPSTCVSNDGSITITGVTGGTGGVGPYTFAWTGSGTGLNPTAQNQTGLSAGTYIVTITDVPSGCTTVQSFALPGPGGCICPTISSLTTNPSVNGCINTNVTLNATGLANMGTSYGITFKYSTSPLADPYVGGTVIANVPNASLTAGGTAASTTTTFAVANTYYIYAVLSPTPPDPTCRPSQSVILPVYGNPSFTSQPVNRTICSGQSTTFDVTTSGSPVTYQWQINQGAGFINLTNVAPFSGVTTATLVVTGATTVYNGNTFRCVLGPCGGATSNIVTLTVNPLPIITVGPNGLCAPVTLIAAGNSNTYSWAPATGLNTTTGSTVIATPAVNTTYTVTGTITATGCTNNASVNVLGNSTAAVLSGTATICNGQTTNLVVTITGGVGPFTVVYNNGAGNVTVNNYNSGANIPVSPSTTTNYTLVSVTGANGCAGGGINATPITVTVNPLPTIAVGPNNQCSPVILTATGTSNTYSWSPATGLSATTGATVTATTTATTVYTVTGTITATGCQNSAIVTVLGTPLTPVLSPTSANICLGGIVQLNATATPAARWTPVTGLYTDVTAVTPYVAGTPLNTVYAKPTTNTTYSVTSVSGTCTSPAATIVVTVTQPLSITTQPVNTAVCVGSNTTISVVTAGTLQTYQWQVSTDGGVTFNNLTNTAPYNNVNSATLNINNAPASINNNRYRVLISNSCASLTSNAVILTVNALTPVSATPLSNRICISDSLVNLVGTPVGGVWTGVGVYGNTFLPVRASVGTYTLTYTYTNSNNCVSTTTVVAKVENCADRIRELDNKGVLVYPNPNDGHFSIKVNSTLYNYLGMRVFTSAGSFVRAKSWTNLRYGTIIPVDLSNLAAGVYQVKIFYDDGARTQEKTFNVVIAH